MAFQMTDIIPALPEIFLAGLALVLVLVAAFGGEGAGNARRVTRLSLVGIAIAMFLLVQGDAMPSLAFGGRTTAVKRGSALARVKERRRNEGSDVMREAEA